VAFFVNLQGIWTMNGFVLFFQKELRVFSIIWIGQLITRLGSAMTRFALIIWAYNQAGDATTLALMGFFSCISFVLISPFSGVFVDRWNRRKVMMIADFGAGIMTVVMLIALSTGHLQIWHLYLAEVLSGFFEAFQSPAYDASVSLLVPPAYLTRANGLNSLANYASAALAPVVAGLLLNLSGLKIILIIDTVTMLVAVATLFVVKIPQPETTLSKQISIRQTMQESKFGIRYIFSRPGLAGIMIIFFFINLFGTISYFAVLNPMILAKTGGDTMALSTVQTAMGAAGIIGSFLVSIWGGKGKKVKTYLISTALSFFITDLMFAVGQSVLVWVMAGIISTLTIPYITSPYYAIWQEKIPAGVQGKVFSVRNMFQRASQPIGYILGGYLADQVFGPAIMAGGTFAKMLGPLIGTGPGAGMAAIFVCTAVFGTLTGIVGFVIPSIRNVEEDLPNAIVAPGFSLESPSV
jgi:MFS transporter, DHA3 family, macrolide efflux protein